MINQEFDVLTNEDNTIVIVNCRIDKENEIDGWQVFGELGYFDGIHSSSYIYLYDKTRNNRYLVNIEFDSSTGFSVIERVVLDIIEI